MTLLEEAKKFKVIFDIVNKDTEEFEVPYSDKEFYADQVYILNNEEDFERAKQIAELLATL